MRTALMVLVTLVLAGCSDEPRKPAKWKVVVVYDENSRFEYDEANVGISGSRRTVFTRGYSKPGFLKHEPQTARIDNTTEINCEAWSYTTLHRTAYDASGKLVDDSPIKEPFQKIEDIDPNGRVAARVCGL